MNHFRSPTVCTSGIDTPRRLSQNDSRRLRRGAGVTDRLKVGQGTDRRLRFLEPGAVLVGDYAAYWLETLPSRLKPRTVNSYRELYRLHLAPSLKGIGLSELRRAQVKALLLDKQRQGLSRNTVRLIGSCLSALCSEAIDDGILSVIPAAALGRWLRGPSEHGTANGQPENIRPFTTGEVASILATARKFYPRYYPLFLT